MTQPWARGTHLTLSRSQELGEVDGLILQTCKRRRHPIDVDDRPEVLFHADGGIPAHRVVVDRHDPVGMLRELLLKSYGDIRSFGVVLVAAAQGAVNGEDRLQCHCVSSLIRVRTPGVPAIRETFSTDT